MLRPNFDATALQISHAWTASNSLGVKNALSYPLQMAVAKAEQQQGTFRGPVVVLADKDKAEMDAAVAQGLQGPANLEVCTLSRTGAD